MTFPLPPNEAVIYAEFVRLLDATEVSMTEGEPRARIASEADQDANVVPGARAAEASSPSVTESLFPNEERAA